MKVYKTAKRVGQTPLEALISLRKKKKIPHQHSLTYAGRLDPMAEGLLLVLENATQKEKDHYLKLPKKYQAFVLLGFSTDSWDILGMPTSEKNPKIFQREQIQKALKAYKENTPLPLPAFSSVPYKGKPMFYWAQKNYFKKNSLPIREMHIDKCKLTHIKNIDAQKLLHYIQSSVKKTTGDFRQKEILKKWQSLLKNSHKSYCLLQLSIDCQSGTYIRSIAHNLGVKLGYPSCLFALKRTHIGRFGLKNAIIA